MSGYILAIDQGTTSSRAILFDAKLNILASHQQEFPQHFPASGWVEHELEDIWRSVVESCRCCIQKSGIAPSSISGIGITNQRETTVVWDKKTGKAIHPAIVWQDRRTAEICQNLKSQPGFDEQTLITEKTGLLLDPYFSATKIAWILDTENARKQAEKGELLFGTVDSYLVWKLTDGKVHKTDATNASRTNLFNIHSNTWDDELCELFRVPKAMLPQVEDCNHHFGVTAKHLLGAEIPIAGIAGDQQAAAIGQGCFESGMLKSTYGTGCFALMNTGSSPITSRNKLLSTIAYRLDGKTHYALEGSIFIAGAAVQWLRDGIKIIYSAEETSSMAREANPQEPIILVPAFAGLGAPYWQSDVRGAIFGLSRNTGRNELVKATLESVCYQTRDLLQAMLEDFKIDKEQLKLRVDGGMAASDWTMQCLADTLGCQVDRPQIIETTALGAAWLAGYTTSTWGNQEEFAKLWKLNQSFHSLQDDKSRQKNYARWQQAIRAAMVQCEGE